MINHHKDRATVGCIYLDGKKQWQEPIVRKGCEGVFRGLLVDHKTMHPFKFCALKLTGMSDISLSSGIHPNRVTN